jgi:hypothetical protein
VSRTVYRAVIGTVPEPELSPNARTHRMVRARKQRELREFTHWSVRETAPESPLTGRVTVTVTIGWPKRRPGMDIDNATACLKGAIDGVVDAGHGAVPDRPGRTRARTMSQRHESPTVAGGVAAGELMRGIE